MGRRNHAETLIAIVEAFHQSRTWTQAALADRVGVEPRRIRVLLDVLIQTKHFPLERSVEGRHVYWSLPKRWVAGGLVVPEAEIVPLVRLLARAPQSEFQRRTLAMALACMAPRLPRPVDPQTIAAPARGDFEERMLALVEESAARRCALSLRYFTPSRGEVTERWLSVQRIDPGPPARFIAYCHKAKELRTFRANRIRSAALDHGVPFVHVDEEEVEEYARRSVNGYHGPAREAVLCRFFVRDPDARWVADNLPAPMRATPVDGGIEVTVETTAVERVAPFVVGLGASATASTPVLREAVRALAEGALAALAKGEGTA